MSEFALRPMRDTDLGFIYKSWSEGLYDSPPYCHADRSEFRRRQREHMDKVLSEATTIVASPPGDSETILGWVCCQRCAGALVVHWAYVRNSAREGGIGRLLLAAVGWQRGEKVRAPQWSKDMKWIREKVDVVWDPWVAE